MFQKLKNMFNRKTVVSSNTKVRSFKSARSSRFTNWIFSGFNKINRDLKNDLKTLILRSRDLAKNNELFRSHLNNLQKSIVGRQGFRLQSLIKLADGGLDEQANNELENAWWNFGRRSNGILQQSGSMGDVDFDILVLRTLIIDGEVFIRINREAKNEYGISFEILDGLCIDPDKNRKRTQYQNAIVMGVEIDEHNKPVQYWFRKGDEDSYTVGFRQAIPASDIIHIYKQQFVGQTRGFGDIVASIDSLKQLDDFAISQLIAAKIASCQGIFYQRNSQQTAGDFMQQREAEEEQTGTFLTEMSPGEASIVPKGYSVKAVTPNHPNSNFAAFTKAIVRRIASACGISYNRLSHDYQAVNYSSLREASIDEAKTYANLQRFMIENWKEIQYQLFVKSYIINYAPTKLKAVHYADYISSFHFMARRDALFDQAKQIIGIERKLSLGLTNPIKELQEFGLDPEQVLDGWMVWNKMCVQRGINFEYDVKLPLDVVEQYNEEANNIQQEEEN